MPTAAQRPCLLLALLCSLLAPAGCGPVDGGQQEAPPPSSAPAATATAAPTPPIVILISLDTLRADHLGLYGYPRFTSPVIDTLARDGVVFDDASSTAPWTLPSHASILTGLFPGTNGVQSWNTPLPPLTPTLASILEGRGWTTAAVVNSLWLQQKNFGLTRDFEKYEYVDSPADKRTPTTWVTDQAMQWLRDRGDRKLFLFMHYYDVHADYASEPQFEKLFVRPYHGKADGTAWQLLRATLEDEYLDLCHHHFDKKKCTFGSKSDPRVIDDSVQKVVFDQKDADHLRDLYDAGIRQLDTELGRFFAFLRREDLLSKTLLIVTADHGEEFLDHGRVDHFVTMYQEMLHVPLIILGPGIPAGLRIEEPVSSVDIAPTILSFVGIEPPQPMDGIDLAPLWRGETPPGIRDRFLYGEASGSLTINDVVPGIYSVHRSVRQGRYKLIHQSKGDLVALYDLAEDPHEQVDVARQHPDVEARLLAQLRRRQEEIASRQGSEGPLELDPEEAARLRELGYIVP